VAIKAYVLFKVSSGAEREICRKISDLDEVLEASIIYGEYDLIAKVKAEKPDKRGEPREEELSILLERPISFYHRLPKSNLTTFPCKGAPIDSATNLHFILNM